MSTLNPDTSLGLGPPCVRPPGTHQSRVPPSSSPDHPRRLEGREGLDGECPTEYLSDTPLFLGGRVSLSVRSLTHSR